MNPGDLVELIATLGCDGWVEVGGLDNNGPSDRRRGHWPAGTLAVFIDRTLSMADRPASVILIDGSRGWIWNDEIRPISTLDGVDHESR